MRTRTNCAGSGECADIEVQSTLGLRRRLGDRRVTVTDKTPYDAVNNKNDCNGNGGYRRRRRRPGLQQQRHPGRHGQARPPINEPTGEIAVLDQDRAGSPVYKGNFPYSSLYDSPGSLFVQINGTANPVVTALYDDRNDGTGVALQERARRPSSRDSSRANCTIVLDGVAASTSRATTSHLAAGSPGDNDGFADRRRDDRLHGHAHQQERRSTSTTSWRRSRRPTPTRSSASAKPIVSAGSAGSTTPTFTTPPFRFKVKGTVDRARDVERSSSRRTFSAHAPLQQVRRDHARDRRSRSTSISTPRAAARSSARSSRTSRAPASASSRS